MNTVEEIERMIAQLPSEHFERLAEWMERRRHTTDPAPAVLHDATFRDHSAFLNSYAPGDEGLYDDAAAR
jgi:hypothetical protein